MLYIYDIRVEKSQTVHACMGRAVTLRPAEYENEAHRA